MNSKKPFSLIVIGLLITISVIATYTALNSSKQTDNAIAVSKSNIYSMDGNNMIMNHNMDKDVIDDKSFIESMIPHHQEAIDSSNLVKISTKNKDLMDFTTNVIDTQTKEIADMKSWYKTWYGDVYIKDSNYQPMMTEMNGETAEDLDKAYIKGMIMHHQGAISMAKKAKTISKRIEILTLSENIITSQTKEVNQLMDWMMSKYGDHSMMGM
jgi:uncharacterized protein (DUF305 family)